MSTATEISLNDIYLTLLALAVILVSWLSSRGGEDIYRTRWWSFVQGYKAGDHKYWGWTQFVLSFFWLLAFAMQGIAFILVLRQAIDGVRDPKPVCVDRAFMWTVAAAFVVLVYTAALFTLALGGRDASKLFELERSMPREQGTYNWTTRVTQSRERDILKSKGLDAPSPGGALAVAVIVAAIAFLQVIYTGVVLFTCSGSADVSEKTQLSAAFAFYVLFALFSLVTMGMTIALYLRIVSKDKITIGPPPPPSQRKPPPPPPPRDESMYQPLLARAHTRQHV